jgi:hypothetical protein
MSYPVKVWLCSICVVSPVIMFISSSFIDWHFVLDKEGIAIFLIFFGLFLSLPTLAATYLAFLTLTRRKFSKIATRVWCCMVANVGVIVTFWILEGSMMLNLTLVYTLGTTLSFLIIRVKVAR